MDTEFFERGIREHGPMFYVDTFREALRNMGVRLGPVPEETVSLDEQLEKVQQEIYGDGPTESRLETYFKIRVRKGDAGPRGRAPVPGVTDAICIECRHCRWYNNNTDALECEATANPTVDHRTGIVTLNYGACQSQNREGKCGHFDRIPMGRFKKFLRRNGSSLHAVICMGSVFVVAVAVILIGLLIF